MYFTEIELSDFRNYVHESVKFHRNVNIILGENAQGKTNLLEALYMTSSGRSFRHVRDREMIRMGAKIAGIRAEAVKEDRLTTVEIGIIKNAKSIKVDGVNLKKTSQLLNNIHIVMFSPEDLSIVKDEPARRRRFVDRELSQISPVYYSDLTRYNRVLQQKNAALRNGITDDAVLDIWDSELASYGASVIRRRDDFIRKLSAVSSSIHTGLTDGREKFSAEYAPSMDVAGSMEEQREHVLDLLRESRQQDIERGRTGRGPQRDDIRLFANGMDVRKYGSQGQQRTAALSLKLAEIDIIKNETGDSPVLLLDDVLSELDRSRQRQLMSAFHDVQIFITSTEMDDEMERDIPEHTRFQVENGKVSIMK